MKMMVAGATKRFAPSAAASRRRCPVLAARPGSCIFFLARQMSCSAAGPAPRREKRSEQTIYDAATRKDLQIDFPAREAVDAAGKLRWEASAIQRAERRADSSGRICPRNAKSRVFPCTVEPESVDAGRENIRTIKWDSVRAWKLFAAEEVGDFSRYREEY